MASDVLKAYLISIGFKVDEAEYRKFRDKIETSDRNMESFWKKTRAFAKTAAEAVTAFGVATFISANRLEKLYFASHRIGTSVKNLQAFAFGARQIGVSAEEAQTALENMARNIRLNPGLQGLLGQMGVNPQEDRVQQMLDLVQKFRQMPFYQAAGLAQLFGIDDQTLYMLEQNFGELQKWMETRKKAAAEAGTDADAMAEKSHKFMQGQRTLEENFQILTDLATTKLLPDLDRLTDKLDDLLKFFLKLDKATSGWSSTLGGLSASLLGLIGGAAGLRSILGRIGLGAGAGEAAGGLGLMEGVAGLGGLFGLGLSGYEFWHQYHMTDQEKEDRQKRRLELMKENQARNNSLNDDIFYKFFHPNTDLHNPGNLRSWGDMPTVERFRRGRSIGNFAQFGSDREGLRALAQQLILYGNRGLDTVQGIVGTYAPAKENDVPAYIKDLTRRLGVGASTHLNLSDPQVLANLMGAMIHHEQGKDPFNSQMLLEAANYRLGAPQEPRVSLHQETKIIIQGSKDPDRTAEKVADVQKRVNGDIVRDLGATVR